MCGRQVGTRLSTCLDCRRKVDPDFLRRRGQKLFLYLIRGEVNGKVLHKIGVTNKIAARLRKLFRGGFPADLSVVANSHPTAWSVARTHELALHHRFAQKRIDTTEWFDLSPDEVEPLAKEVVSFGI